MKNTAFFFKQNRGYLLAELYGYNGSPSGGGIAPTSSIFTASHCIFEQLWETAKTGLARIAVFITYCQDCFPSIVSFGIRQRSRNDIK